MRRFSHVDTWIFDLDNTLYNAECGIFLRVGERMTDYIAQRLSLPRDEANDLRHHYWKKYGTSMRGLMVEHKIDPDAFLDHVHDVNISDVPQCQITMEHLARLPGRKFVFTSAPRRFAADMTRHLGVHHHFESIFAIEDAGYLPKPHIETYHAALKKFEVQPVNACMFEDMAVNLKPAADLGMTTVWLHGKHQAPDDHAHVHHKFEKLSDWFLDIARD